jgi:hypothetical protein
MWPGGLTLARAQAVALAPDAALVVGDDDKGNLHVFRASATDVQEIALHAPRHGGRVVPLSTGASVIVGGATDIESYRD